MSEFPARLRRWRQHLSGIAETGMREHRTGDYLAGELGALGLEVTRGVGGTGLVATVRGDDGGRAISLRADMDGLPLPQGVLHACGHDGHMAMLLGAGHRLATEGGFAGAVHLVFQPAEEHGLGAAAMIADGLFERFPAEAIFGLHTMPGQPAGRISTRPGPLMAAEDNFEIRITGRGGHASRPQLLVDPIVVAAQLVLALQTVVSRSLDPADPAVLSCTEITTDGARNAIPGVAVIRGDTRSFSPDVRSTLEQRIREISAGICAAHGATCEVDYTHEFEPTVNDPGATAQAVAAARLTVGEDAVDADSRPWTASEDFGVFATVVPACFALLGAGEDSAPLHSAAYRFNDDVLETGVDYYVNLVRSVLAP